MRRDPRLDRTDPAVVAEFYDSLWEIHHYRLLAIGGAFRLREEVEAILRERVEASGVEARVDHELQAAWERAELARAAIDTDFPLLNAMGVAQHVFVLDALVEELAPNVQEMVVESAVREQLKKAAQENPKLAAEVEGAHGNEVWDPLLEAAVLTILQNERWPGRPSGTGSNRYAKILRAARMPPLPDLPQDLEHALAEAHTIRNVVVHRGGFVDQRAIDDCPSLPFPTGELLRLCSHHYRRYSAAVRTFAELVIPFVQPNLVRWQHNYLLGS
jgi:hypothetical protein